QDDAHVIHVRSVFTETRTPSLQPPDMIVPKPQLWGHATLWIRDIFTGGWTYPSVGSVTYRSADDVRKSRATIAHQLDGVYMPSRTGEVSVQWAAENMSDWRIHTWGGLRPNTSETPDSQRV